MFRIAFVGNSNVGKSSWVNYLSGSAFKIANYSGVSVDVKSQSISYQGKLIDFIDLPGLYDLYKVSGEEVYAKEYLLKEPIDLLVNVIDVRDIKRGIHLCAQLKRLHIPMIVLLNFVHHSIQEEQLLLFSESIHTPVLNVSMKDRNRIIDTLLKIPDYYEDTIFDERSIYELPFISKKEYGWDTYLLHPVYGVLFLLFFLMFSIISLFAISNPISHFIDFIGNKISAILLSYAYPVFIENVLSSFLFSIFTFLSFLPFLSLLFLYIALLEESGYMARIAYLLHPFLKRFQLSGNSVIPLLVGYGCSVPAILSTRTIEDKKERIKCALMIPFISCSGKIPIYLLFISVFFKGKEILVFLLLYSVSLSVSLFVSFFFSSYKEEIAFFIELPSYQIPDLNNVLHKVKEEIIGFIKKAWKVIAFGMFILIFVLPYINIEFLQVLFNPLHFVSGSEVIESISLGLLSKENVAFYFTGNNINLTTLWNSHESLFALCYLLYVSMSIPCVMTLSAIKNEFNGKILLVSVLLMLLVPYVICLFVSNFFLLFI